MHEEILTPAQAHLTPLVERFAEQFGLVGGTAVALQIGHRESIDFDLFSHEPFDTAKVKRTIRAFVNTDHVLRDETGQYTIVIQGVQFTFFHYPYGLSYAQAWRERVRLPDLCTLAAMKAFALGRRAKWKDYVDLYFILKDHVPLSDIISKSISLFGAEFNEKLIREQLAYFEDINYSEAVTFKPGFEVSDEEVKAKLTEWSLS